MANDSLTGGLIPAKQVLAVGAGALRCALPLEHVIETMRPLPVERIGDAPSFVLGVCVIRGIPTPVVDLRTLLGLNPSDETNQHLRSARFVTVRLEKRQVALSLDSVFGVLDLRGINIEDLPPLLQSNDAERSLGILDSHLMVMLGACWQLPDAVWNAIEVLETAS